MSLLLEALKKAERAREEAQRRAKGEAPDAGALQLEGEPAADGKHVVTRDELPDISQPLEIVSDDLRGDERGEPASSAAPSPAAQSARPRTRAAPAADSQASERAAAQRVFEAKFREPNPRLPFFIAVGVLGVFALGTVGYFWAQLQPPASLVNASPPRSSDEKPVELAAAKPAAPGPATAAPALQGAIPGLPGQAPAAAPAPVVAAAVPAAPAPAPAAEPKAAPAKPVPSPARAPRAAAAERRPDLSLSRGAPQLQSQLEAGYAAYQAGDLAAARSGYQQALREEPANRDALLGLAAIEMRSQNYAAAEAHYQRLLRADPRDPHAHAGMLALRSQLVDPVAAESRVKSLLATDPEAHVLQFTLGNQYAQQGRWAEAQQAYFRAFSADPDNPDFAYNLAVSLDHLRQPKLALEHYRRALALAEKRGASFNPAFARNRAQELGR